MGILFQLYCALLLTTGALGALGVWEDIISGEDKYHDLESALECYYKSLVENVDMNLDRTDVNLYFFANCKKIAGKEDTAPENTDKGIVLLVATESSLGEGIPGRSVGVIALVEGVIENEFRNVHTDSRYLFGPYTIDEHGPYNTIQNIARGLDTYWEKLAYPSLNDPNCLDNFFVKEVASMPPAETTQKIVAASSSVNPTTCESHNLPIPAKQRHVVPKLDLPIPVNPTPVSEDLGSTTPNTPDDGIQHTSSSSATTEKSTPATPVKWAFSTPRKELMQITSGSASHDHQ